MPNIFNSEPRFFKASTILYLRLYQFWSLFIHPHTDIFSQKETESVSLKTDVFSIITSKKIVAHKESSK